MKKATAIVKAEKNKAVWLGAQSIMSKTVPGTKEAKEQQLVLMTARVLGVSPFGINILGSLPYINKLGLTQKAATYSKRIVYKYNWVKRAMDETEKSICECKVTIDGKDITDWVTGECSPSSMKMGTLKGYQNHMAQTRARNRAILEAYGVRIHEEMMENINKLYQKNEISEKQKDALSLHAGAASSSSVEEVQITEKEKNRPIDNNLFATVVAPGQVVANKQTLPPGAKLGPDGDPVYVCSVSDDIISKAEYDYSMKMFGRPLSRAEQKNYKPKRK